MYDIEYLKELKAKAPEKLEIELNNIRKKLFEKYCKKDYLDECKPAYCVFQYTNNCEYISEMRKINQELSSV